MRDPYAVLGVKRNARQDEIRAAWRDVAKSVHPDTNQDDPQANERFAEAARAYELLKNPHLRNRYDDARREAELRRMEEAARKARGATAADEPIGESAADEATSKIFGAAAKARATEPRSGPATGPSPQASSRTAPPRATPEPAPKAEARPEPSAPVVDPIQTIVKTAAPAAELLSALMRRLTGAGTKKVDKVPDLICDAVVSVEDVFKRNRITISLPDDEALKVSIPLGTIDGHVLRLKEQGHTVAGLKRGDAVVTFRIVQTGAFRTEGLDLRTTLPVSIENAVLGCETNVETLTGPVAVSVPAWSGSDRVIRLAGHGLADAEGKRGDLLVEVRIMLWEKPDDKMTDLMRSLREGLYL